VSLRNLLRQRPWEYAQLTRSRDDPSDELHDAARAGHVDLVLKLLDEKNYHADRESRHGETALMIATRADNRSVIEALIKRGAQVDITGRAGLSALHIASMVGVEEAARALIDSKADVSMATKAPDTDSSAPQNKDQPHVGLTSLMLSILHKQHAITILLLEAKANPNQIAVEKFKGVEGLPSGPPHMGHGQVQAVHCAIRVKSLKALKILLERAVDLDESSPILKSFNPLGFASKRGMVDVARMLLENKADPNRASADPLGSQPLHCAAAAGHVDIVHMLLKQGANRDSRDSMGLRPLDVAIGSGEYEIAHMLDETSIYAQPCS